MSVKHAGKFLLLSVLIVANIDFAFTQGVNLCPPAESKKATKYLDEAKAAKKSKKDYKEIKELLENAIEEDTAFAEPWLMLGDVAYSKKDYVTMKKAYARLIALCPDADAIAYYRMGTYLFETKKYQEAVPYLKSFLEFAVADETKNTYAETLLFRAKMIANPVPFNPVLLKGVSTADPVPGHHITR